MNGPEHYIEAERLADRVHHFTYGDGGDPVTGAALAAEAQVHASLAQAAAVATLASMLAFAQDINDADIDAWVRVAGVTPEGGADRG
ncbi:hypothetical protein ACH4LK_22475 [Streptomyces lydicus]|uniref:hypothetical protein n=1 Tax=Streptomyces lydicus TaxID=47763 RepID=UPI00379D1E91